MIVGWPDYITTNRPWALIEGSERIFSDPWEIQTTMVHGGNQNLCGRFLTRPNS